MPEEEDEGYLNEEDTRWIQDEADKHFDGRWGAAAAAILHAAYVQAHMPDQPWAGLDTRLAERRAMNGRRRPDGDPKA